MNFKSELHKFIFEDASIRGSLVQLDLSDASGVYLNRFPALVMDLFEQCVAASLLMSSTLKFKGRMILQLHSKKALKLLLVQVDDQLKWRGLIQYDQAEDQGISNFRELCQEGYLVVTIEPEGKQKYQGIVELKHDNLEKCLENYFIQSEQLLTQVRLFNHQGKAAGMLLQVLPEESPQEDKLADDFEHFSVLGATLSKQEALNLDKLDILHRLFHQHNVRLFPSLPAKYHCQCSHQHYLKKLEVIPQKELMHIIEEQGKIEVTCDFCSAQYHYDGIDITCLFTQNNQLTSFSELKH